MMGKLSALGNVARLLAAFVVLAVAAGLLGAGLAIPAVGATGSTVKGGVQVFDDLPSELTRSPLNQQSRILDADGGVIATPYSENRIIVPLDRVAPIMQKAQIAIEDSRFYEHGGVDVRGLSRAVVSTLEGQTQGASTITQQYVKMTLQENALNEDDQTAADAAVARSGVEGVTRKLQELKYAVKLEQTLTKDQILQGYLNLAYYGDQAYGIQAAAEHYFSIPAAQLDYNQAALLAGLVQQPSSTDPVNHPKVAQARRDVVLDRMAQLGVITHKQAVAGKEVSVTSMLKVKESQNTCERSSQPYFCTYVMAWLQTQPVLGSTPAERLKNINTQGLTIQTSFEPKLAARTEKYLEAKVKVGDPSGVGSAATVVEPGTGRVLAMAQTSSFRTTQVNWNVDEEYGGSTGQQFGSTAKMFALVRALSTGTSMNSSVYAKPASATRAASFYALENNGTCGDWTGPWNVRNDESMGGDYSLRTAIAESINTAFAGLVLKLGVCNVQDTMTQMGLHRGNGDPIQRYPSSVTLGADEVTPLTLASAYATLAAGGRYCTPTPVTSITDSDGKSLDLPASDCKQVVDKDVAAEVTNLLESVLTFGTASGTTGGGLSGGRPAAGKTGTTDSHVESWFVGYTPQLATAVWVGTPTTNRSMNNIRIGGRYYASVSGATIAAPLWKQIMDYASSGLPVEQFDSVPAADGASDGAGSGAGAAISPDTSTPTSTGTSTPMPTGATRQSTRTRSAGVATGTAPRASSR